MPFQNCKTIESDADSDKYHAPQANRGERGFIVSPSMLREFGHCPARWIANYDPPQSDAKEFGSLFDCLVLTPKLFDEKYALRPDTFGDEGKPWNNNSNECKAWNKKAQDAGKSPLKRAEYEEAKTARDRLFADEILRAFHDASEKQVWIKGEWRDGETIIPVQGLIDYVPDKKSVAFGHALGDLKTTRSAHPAVWSRYSSQRKYHLQAAFYLDLFNAATGECRESFCHVLSENFPPYQTGRSLLDDKKIACGRALYQSYLRDYCKCLISGVWPGYQREPGLIEGWSLDMASKWDEQEAMAAWGNQPEESETEPEPDEQFSAH